MDFFNRIGRLWTLVFFYARLTSAFRSLIDNYFSYLKTTLGFNQQLCFADIFICADGERDVYVRDVAEA
jgi:hypothetical protein